MRLVNVALVALVGCTEPAGSSPGFSRVVMLDIPVSGGGSPCFDGTLADVDPNTPGDQFECTVSDVRNVGMANQAETVLPACNNVSSPPASTNKPCWVVQPDMTTCAAAPHLSLLVERAEAPSADTHVIASCVAEL